MYTSEKRVTRGGYLIAYKGERMSEDEARRRGLIGDEKSGRKPTRRKAKAKSEPEED